MLHNLSNEPSLCNILRKVTRTAKLFPFVYTLLLIVICPTQVILPTKTAVAISLFTFPSIPSMFICLRLASALRLCNFYRVQCFVMFLPNVIPLSKIIFGQVNIYAIWIAVSLSLIISLINYHFVFNAKCLNNKRK